MPIQQLTDFINLQRSQNKSNQEIEEMLSKSGWRIEDIHSALGIEPATVVPVPPADYFKPAVEQNPAPVVPAASVTTPVKNNFWDAFEHILMFISMGVFAVAFALILHQMVDANIPSVVSEYSSSYSSSSYMSSYSSTLMQGYVASLLVSMPLFTVFFLRITKRTKANPALRNMPLRKFLIYTTMIITFIAVLINVIGIVFTLLGGNISWNVVLHFIISVGISSIIFAYYIIQTKEDRK